MRLKRRNFMVTLGASLGLSQVFAPKGKAGTHPYKAIISCVTASEEKGFESFEEDRVKWENPGEILKMCQKYSENGRLLDYSVKQTKKEIIWEYVFRSRKDFEDWNREVFLSGFFDQSKVSSTYSYKVDGYYI